MLSVEQKKDILSFIQLGISTGNLVLEKEDVAELIDAMSNGKRGVMETGKLPSNRLYSYKEAMEFLSLKKSSFYRLISSGVLHPVYLSPKNPRIKESELSSFSES